MLLPFADAIYACTFYIHTHSMTLPAGLFYDIALHIRHRSDHLQCINPVSAFHSTVTRLQ